MGCPLFSYTQNYYFIMLKFITSYAKCISDGITNTKVNGIRIGLCSRLPVDFYALGLAQLHTMPQSLRQDTKSMQMLWQHCLAIHLCALTVLIQQCEPGITKSQVSAFMPSSHCPFQARIQKVPLPVEGRKVWHRLRTDKSIKEALRSARLSHGKCPIYWCLTEIVMRPLLLGLPRLIY